jgi:hypothetical protein
MAEFWRVLKTLKALQAGQARDAGAALSMSPMRPAARPQPARHPLPNEPGRCPQHRVDTLIPEASRGLHESPAIWRPNGPEQRAEPARAADLNQTNPRRCPRSRPGGCRENRRTDDQTNPAVPE